MSITYFEGPGPKNTKTVIRTVRKRLTKGDIRHVVVATESGKTALAVARELKDTDVKIACVAPYGGYREVLRKREPRRRWLHADKATSRRLNALGVAVLDHTPWIFGCTFDSALLGKQAPGAMVHRFLSRLFGFGIKTCIEIALIASDAGAIPVGSEAIAIAGTGWLGGGADAALVFRAAPIYEGAFLKNDGGMEVLEILAMPRRKFSKHLVQLMQKAGKDEP